MTAGSHKRFLFDNDFGLVDGLHTRHKNPKIGEDKVETAASADIEAATVEAETVEAPPPPPPPTYSQEDLDRARNEGMKIGRDDATRDMASALEQRLVNTLDAINARILALFDAYTQDKDDRSRNAVAVAAIIVRKLFPSMNMDKAMGEIEHMIVEAMQRTSGNPSLIVRVPKEMHPEVQAKAKELAALRGREGTLNVLVDEALAMGDVAVEWEGGGMIRDTQFIWQEIDGIIERNLGQKLDDFSPPPAEKKPTLEPRPGPKSEQLVVNTAQVGENDQNTAESSQIVDDATESHMHDEAHDEPEN